jgi:hypothetical protein
MDPLLSDAFNFLEQQQLGVISTITQDNTPESACVNYLPDRDWKIFVLTSSDSRKVQNIKNNNHTSFVVGVANTPNTTQIQADAQILEDGSEEFNLVLQKFKDSGRLNRDPIYTVFGSSYVILKLNITWLRWLYFEKDSGKEVYTVFTPAGKQEN